MSLYWARFKTQVTQLIRFLNSHAYIYLILAIFLMAIAIFNMYDKNTSAGMWTILTIAIILFLIGISQLTGLSLGMSF